MVMSLIVRLAVTFGLAWFIFPDAGVLYDGWLGAWFFGVMHGGLAPANWVIQHFVPGHAFRADTCSTAYTVWWWFGIVTGVLNTLTSLAKDAKKSE